MLVPSAACLAQIDITTAKEKEWLSPQVHGIRDSKMHAVKGASGGGQATVRILMLAAMMTLRMSPAATSTHTAVHPSIQPLALHPTCLPPQVRGVGMPNSPAPVVCHDPSAASPTQQLSAC